MLKNGEYMGKGSKAPSPPDPNVQAQAQAAANRDAVETQARVNRVNQVTPYGSLTYKKNYDPAQVLNEVYRGALGRDIDSQSLSDRMRSLNAGQGTVDLSTQIQDILGSEEAKQARASGLVTQPFNYNLPASEYTVETQLTPEQQALLQQQNQLSSQLNTLGINQTQKLTGLLDKPVNLNNQATEQRLYDLGRQRIDPRFAEQEQTLRNRLANQGFSQNTEAYQRQIRDFEQSRNDAYNNLLLTGRQQAVQEALTERNQPINEITALMGAGQVTLPQFSSVPQVNVPTTDVAGLQNQAYQNQLAAYQMNQQPRARLMSGLFGLGSAALGGWAGGG
jgi:hypothetical protein